MNLRQRRASRVWAALALMAAAPTWAGSLLAPAGLPQFDDTILVANDARYAPTVMVDPNLVNPWGIALRPPGIGGHIWLSNAGTGTTTTYIGDVGGKPLYQDGLKVIPIQTGSGWDGQTPAQVTGQAYNAASDIAGQPTEFFVSGPAADWRSGQPIPVGTVSGSAKFVFVTLDGTINAWRSGTNPGMTEAVVVKDMSGTFAQRQGLAYTPTLTGVAMTTDAYRTVNGQAVADNRLFATDFANNRVMVFDNQWNDISHQVRFERPAGLQDDFQPFNVQVLGGRVYVTYAGTDPHDELGEPIRAVGAGRVVAYDRDGHVLQDFDNEVPLNAPWGLAIAPSSWGALAGKLLVGNFGDGSIAAFDTQTGAFVDFLRDSHGQVIHIDGLWGLTFGNGVALGDANALYYAAGPRLEEDGLFGRLTVSAVPEPQTLVLMLAGSALLTGVRRRSA
ncbi:MAG: TIGR03118 family protein [Burkholderiales bacterium]|nr:MAG: TIGR03118 family protein [Burkholderiales bacterium]